MNDRRRYLFDISEESAPRDELRGWRGVGLLWLEIVVLEVGMFGCIYVYMEGWPSWIPW